MAIIGGGISGLSAAYYAIQHGQNPADITVYEATGRLGGKIQNGMLGDVVVNRGAEFIDSTNARLIRMCQELDVPLKAATDQQTEIFQMPDGSTISGEAFHQAFAPITAQILRHKEEVLRNPGGETAQWLNQLTLDEYLTQLQASTAVRTNRSVFQQLWDAVTFQGNRVPDAVMQVAKGTFSAEVGQPANRASALQFVHEHGDMESFFSSDCAYRVEGGTEALVLALHQKLAGMGVHFKQQAKLEAVQKSEGGMQLHFAGGAQTAHTQMVLALPAYALADIEGLEAMGLHARVRPFLQQMQYTDSVKFTIRLKPGQQVPQGSVFSAGGYECWPSDPGTLTFLCQGDSFRHMPPAQAMQGYLESFAASQGKRASDVFDTQQVMFTNPGSKACYASPGPGQAMACGKLAQACDALAANGIAITGTYFPMREQGGVGTGFMECGVSASEHAIGALLQKQSYRQEWLSQILDKPRNGYAEQASAERAAEGQQALA